MTNEELTILIERYLDGELSDQERQQFEQELKTNKELADELMLHEAIRSAIGDEEYIDLREKLGKIRYEYHEKKKKRTIVYASCAVIVVLFIATLFLCNKSYTNDELFDLYYEHYDAGTITKGEVKPGKEIYTNALRTYDNGNYTEAITLLEQITDTSVFYTSKEFFTGLSYMELKRFGEAEKRLVNALRDTNCICHESIIWYCGLCYLKTNQTEKAKRQFLNLKNSSACFQNKSEEILKKIQ